MVGVMTRWSMVTGHNHHNICGISFTMSHSKYRTNNLGHTNAQLSGDEVVVDDCPQVHAVVQTTKEELNTKTYVLVHTYILETDYRKSVIFNSFTTRNETEKNDSFVW